MTRHTVTLKYPVEHGGQAVTSLSFRRPKVRDLRTLSDGKGSDTDRSLDLLASLGEIEVSLLEELDPVDFAAINEWLEPILDPKARSGTSIA